MQEGDGAEPGVVRGERTGGLQGRADDAEQDAERGAGKRGIAREKGADPLGQGEPPLAQGERGQDVVGEVGGDLDHAAGIAGGADATALAREGDEALGGAGVAADARETVGENTAAQVGAKVVLDPVGHAEAGGVSLGGFGQKLWKWCCTIG